MKNKESLSLSIILCIVLSLFSIPVLAGEQDSQKLEKAILEAKKIINIPDAYTGFTHRTSQRDRNNGKITIWDLSWTKDDDNGDSIDISIGEDGFLYSYSKYESDENEGGLAKISQSEAQSIAEDFLKKSVPKYDGTLKRIEKNNIYYSDNKYNFVYQRYINEVPVDYIILNIGVDKYTGEVTSFSDDNKEIDEEYSNIDNIIESNIAEKNYIENSGVSLKYYSYYDYNENKINVFAGYSLNNKNNLIDAKTGQVVSSYNPNITNPLKKDSFASADNVSNERKLSEAEIDAINKTADLITKEKAEKILRDNFNSITKNMKINYISLNKSYFDETYTWDISFDGAYGSVDAKTGEIISFNFYNNSNNNTSRGISKEKAKSIAENFLKKISPDKFENTKYYDDSSNEKMVIQTSDSYNFNFVRQINGIDFTDNYLNLSIDKVTGNIIEFYNNWNKNLVFPDVSQAIGEEAAFNKIKDLTGFSLKYSMVDENKVSLVYGFLNMSDNYIIDPINGIRIDYNGKAYKENKLPEYTDITGHWSEKIVKELLENGYYIDGDKFSPDMNITQLNFFKYLYSPVRNNYTDDELYNMLIQNGVIKEEEKSPNSLISYGEVSKFIIRYLGYDKLADHPEIFNNPFRDNIQDGYKGYASMCYGLNIIKGDLNGNFNEEYNITNAEAANIIYNLLKVKK